jgi:hypothetical protein
LVKLDYAENTLSFMAIRWTLMALNLFIKIGHIEFGHDVKEDEAHGPAHGTNDSQFKELGRRRRHAQITLERNQERRALSRVERSLRHLNAHGIYIISCGNISIAGWSRWSSDQQYHFRLL